MITRKRREPIPLIYYLPLFLVMLLGLLACESTSSGSSGTFSSDWVITVQPVFSSLKADGASSTHIIITVRSKTGPKPDITVDTTPIYLSVNLGSVASSASLDNDGQAVVTFTAGKTPGTATVRVTYKGSIGSATISLTSASIL